MATSEATGTWSAVAETRFPNGNVETHDLTFVFKQSGSELTGSMGPNTQQQFPIENGKVVSDTLTFDCKWGNGALLHLRLVNKGQTMEGQAEGDAKQIPADPGPNFTNTVYLTLKRSDKP
jgi:hypothetical protein